jgi:hypothetical protein
MSFILLLQSVNFSPNAAGLVAFALFGFVPDGVGPSKFIGFLVPETQTRY